MICKYLDASTGHLTRGEMQLVEAAPDALPRCIPHRYGAWVYVPSDAESLDPALAQIAPNLHAVIEHARANGCSWINFDADGDECEGLATFPWPSEAT